MSGNLLDYVNSLRGKTANAHSVQEFLAMSGAVVGGKADHIILHVQHSCCGRVDHLIISRDLAKNLSDALAIMLAKDFAPETVQ